MSEYPRTMSFRARVEDSQGSMINAEIRLTRSTEGSGTLVTVDGTSEHAKISSKHNQSLAAFFLDLDTRTLGEQLGGGRRAASYVMTKLGWIERYLDEGNVDEARRVVAALQDTFGDDT